MERVRHPKVNNGEPRLGSAAALLALACVLCASLALAKDALGSRYNLPNLPEASDYRPGRFDLNEQSVTLGYGDRIGKWDARVEEYQYSTPSLKLDYGMLLNEKFSAGGAVTRQSDYAEALLSGVYAHKRNLRFRLSAGQLRGASGISDPAGGKSGSVLQHSYLVGAKKTWPADRIVSDLGLSFFQVRATATGADPAAPHAGATESGAMIDPTLSGINGFILDLRLRPTAQSAIDLRRESSNLAYHLGQGALASVELNQVKVSHYLDNCMRLQGRFSTSTSSDRVDLQVAHEKWQLNLSRAMANGGGSTAVYLGYAIPLDGGIVRDESCGARLANAGVSRSFGSLVDAASARPASFPRGALTSMDAASTLSEMP